MKTCIICGEEIPLGRLKALPNTNTCVSCSDVSRKKGFKVITGKTTYSELDIVDEDTYKKLSSLERGGWGSIN